MNQEKKLAQALYFHSINCRGKILDLSTPKVMGILNITPDSFSDGGRFFEVNKALHQVEKMVKEGAAIIDIGAQSTRPNAEFLTAKEEITRLGKLISNVKKEFSEILISIDTFYSEVVRFGFEEGIDMINDISGGNFDKQMFQTVAEVELPYILMHVNPTYDSMHDKLISEELILKINYYFSVKLKELFALGVKDVILDPGFGFGKTVEQQFQMIDEFQFFGFGKQPLLAGISRKSFIYKSLGKLPTEINVETQKFHLQLLEKGARILRVHDVAETKKVVDEFLKL
ncbi:dihydropteroate synthase [Chryseobacterium sp. MP_3.2]|uniref:dihydropteroate synthase n=1 Tax=Chryseobacterium sp. MP_3.2 TaxID=3071712 RepID=UPI002E0A23C4|nr:dihydropteroate synthase [Chryseobacterium sp. MP_3.2]